jgi:hypothetical protein
MPEITKEEYVKELNRHGTGEIATLLKVSEAAVEDWKAGNPSGWPIQWEVVVRILHEKGTSVAAA